MFRATICVEHFTVYRFFKCFYILYFQQIDGEAFLLLTQSDIVKIMNIKLGPALKIFNSIIMFKNSFEV